MFDQLRDHRLSQGLPQDALAAQLGVTRLAVHRIEKGVGTQRLLQQVMKETGFRLSGIGRGATLAEQLSTARRRRGWTLELVATKAGLTAKTVASIERGEGSAASVMKLVRAIAPNWKKTEPPRSSWAFDHTTMGERDKRFTPSWFFALVTKAFGPVDLDPCGHLASSVVARRRIILPEDGLEASWTGYDFIWLNPPYSAAVVWMEKAMDAVISGDCKKLVMLLPVRTDSQTYQQKVARHCDTLFLAQRMRFESTEGLAYAAPFSLMLCIFGATELELACFTESCPNVRMRAYAGR
ncbi:DNA N-6-adenine-methyltransferase Dam [Sphingomonas faeni]|uniref:DNA N-6-adenine-methyltransferase Dam n=1 Tax=Sphingomonas faeni TaxID=185950 RepID=A0A2T5UCK6_9SPHN|nr:DNA N-6-adenine-methyltransferase [Sphingomonas faeni]PTW49204.1 DNA N-6-adenine-methyltransferase Dam [Sphingomonas faeni]